MNEKIYLLDNEPASARDLINRAKQLSDSFRQSCICTTSEASGILRENGYEVKDGHPEIMI